MNKIANRNARQYTQACKPFKGNNLFGEIRGSLYIVYSYGYHWPLFVCDMNNKVWYENQSKYSPTTSKHRGQANPLVNSIIPMTIAEILKFVNAMALLSR